MADWEDQLDADLYTIFFDPATGGKEVTYAPEGGIPVTIRGDFRRFYMEDQAVENYNPIFEGRYIDLADAREDEVITIDGVDYTIHGPAQHDIRGRTTILELTEG